MRKMTWKWQKCDEGKPYLEHKWRLFSTKTIHPVNLSNRNDICLTILVEISLCF